MSEPAWVCAADGTVWACLDTHTPNASVTCGDLWRGFVASTRARHDITTPNVISTDATANTVAKFTSHSIAVSVA